MHEQLLFKSHKGELTDLRHGDVLKSSFLKYSILQKLFLYPCYFTLVSCILSALVRFSKQCQSFLWGRVMYVVTLKKVLVYCCKTLNFKSSSEHYEIITDAEVQDEHTWLQMWQHTSLCVQPSASHKAKVLIWSPWKSTGFWRKLILSLQSLKLLPAKIF